MKKTKKEPGGTKMIEDLVRFGSALFCSVLFGVLFGRVILVLFFSKRGAGRRQASVCVCGAVWGVSESPQSVLQSALTKVW